MFKLYSNKKDAKLKAITMYLSLQKLDYEVIEVSDSNELDVALRDLEFPILIKDDNVIMSGYKPEGLCNIK